MGQLDSKLTDKQIECLRFVSKQMTSKEIARELGVSPFTVDQRIDGARRKLGAATRRDAARIFVELQQASIYETSIYDPSDVEKSENSAILEGPRESDPLSLFDRGNRGFDNSHERSGQVNETKSHIFLPLGGQRQSLNKLQISKSILIIAFLAMICLSAMVIIILGIMEVLK